MRKGRANQQLHSSVITARNALLLVINFDWANSTSRPDL